MADMVEANQPLEERLDKQGNMVYNLDNVAVDWAIQAPLRDRFRELPEADMKEILHHRMWESNSYQAHEDHKMLYEALEKSIAHDHTDQLLTDLAEARRKKKKRHTSPKTPLGSPPHQPPPPPPPAGSSGTPGASRASGLSQLPPPPPPPPSTNQSDQSTSTTAPSSSKTAVVAKYTAWTTTDTRLKPSVSSIPEELHMDDDTTPDEQVQSSGDEDIGHDHIPMVNLRQNTRTCLTGDMAIFMDWFCKKQGIIELKQQDLEGPAYEIVKVFHPNVIHLQYQMEECHKLLTDQVDESILSPALSILKMKAAYYPDVGLEQMVPDQMWIKEECKYDIASIAVRTHMRILSVVRIEVFSLYGYDYMKKIVLRRADLKEYTIAEMDFKYLYPSDFEDLYLLNLQEDFQLGIESYQTQLNLTKPRWDATGFEFKHDFTVIDSLRAVTFWDKYGVQMIMQFNEIHKFSNDTLQQIDEALDYRVKEFKVNRINPDKENLSEPGKLCWWKDKRGRLQTAEDHLGNQGLSRVGLDSDIYGLWIHLLIYGMSSSSAERKMLPTTLLLVDNCSGLQGFLVFQRSCEVKVKVADIAIFDIAKVKVAIQLSLTRLYALFFIVVSATV
ncbi:hypothetical protein Tco_0090986 [Tanacetum coccineum]